MQYSHRAVSMLDAIYPLREQHNRGVSMSYTGYKVPATKVTKNDLAKINNKLAQWGQVPAMIIADWDSNKDNLNRWQNELLSSGDPTQLTWTEPVTPDVDKAIQAYTDFRDSKSHR